MNSTTNSEPEMVSWYDPRQLLNTARKTLISTIVGENADPRLVSAATPDGKFFDYSKQLSIDPNGEFQPTEELRNDIWIDYVSDVGDGWNPTYSVAYSLAQKTLSVSGGDLPRGEILIFGGDAVYPTATSDEYKKRLVAPYRMAFNASRDAASQTTSETETDLKKTPHAFALPGNHDWYDSLVAFQKLFCTPSFNRRVFAGGWRTRQRQSYFALKLPKKWWLLGADLQLSHNLDMRQLEYFESVRKKMEPGDKAILLVPEPYWVKAIKYRGMTTMFEEVEESIDRLEKRFSDKDVEIKVYLAGDLHHYRRFESEDGRRIQKITAGGGGAFLHPTHDFDFDKQYAGRELDADDYTLEVQYPTAAVSRSMDWTNLHSFARKNSTFGILTGILYAVLAFLVHGEITDGKFTWLAAFRATVDRCLEEPLALAVVTLTLIGMIFFTDSNSTTYKRVAGLIHGLVHLTAIFFLGWLGFLVMIYYVGWDKYNASLDTPSTFVNVVWFVSVTVVCFIGGYVIGSIIMGIYLFVSLHIFGRHDNEAFSAMKIEDFKSFLRMHIDGNGKLTIYPIKIDKVGRKWEPLGNDSKRPTEPLKTELIEEPIAL